MNSFYTSNELKLLGLNKVGENVLISRKCSIYDAEKIIIGNNVRIDDFSIISGKISIGNFVHIAAGTYLYGSEAGIIIDDYCGISSHCSVYAATDDYLGQGMTNPMIPMKFRKVVSATVVLDKHVIIGAGSVILPGVHLAEGSAFGAMSLINKSSEEWTVYMGIPIKSVKKRKSLLEIEKSFLKDMENGK